MMLLLQELRHKMKTRHIRYTVWQYSNGVSNRLISGVSKSEAIRLRDRSNMMLALARWSAPSGPQDARAFILQDNVPYPFDPDDVVT